MSIPLPMPKRVPETGLYYHYKHDPTGTVNNYAYEVVGVGFHTEDNCRPGERHFLVYRPLYESREYRFSKYGGIPCFYSRPLAMWMGEVEKDGQVVPRFQKITDPKVIRKLKRIRNKMYP